MEYLQNNVEEAVAAFNAISEEITATGVEVEEGTKPRLLANKIPQVYDKAQGDMWDGIQNYGNRNNYNAGFVRWGNKYIRPRYKVIPTHEQGITQIFNSCRNLKKVEADYFDFSKKPQLFTNTNVSYGYYYTFYYCISLEEIEDIGMIPQNWYSSTYAKCRKLRTIAKMGVDENTKFDNVFYDCTELENLTIDGTIGQNGFDIHWSTKLSAESIDSIVRALSSTTTGLTITLPKDAWQTHATTYGAPNTNELWESKSNWTINELAV